MPRCYRLAMTLDCASASLSPSPSHIGPHSDGSALLFIPSSKTDQEGQGAWGWLSADTMRRVGAWLVPSAITEGPVFRRVGVDRRRLRAAVPPMAYEAIPGHTRHRQEKLRGDGSGLVISLKEGVSEPLYALAPDTYFVLSTDLLLRVSSSEPKVTAHFVMGSFE